MITIYDWFGYELPIKERYQLIKEAGFDGVLLWWSEELNRDDYHSGPQIAREAGLFIENIHTPFKNQNSLWLDNLDGEALTDCYLQCVADCAEFDITFRSGKPVHFHSIHQLLPETRHHAEHERCRVSLRQCSDGTLL